MKTGKLQNNEYRTNNNNKQSALQAYHNNKEMTPGRVRVESVK